MATKKPVVRKVKVKAKIEEPKAEEPKNVEVAEFTPEAPAPVSEAPKSVSYENAEVVKVLESGDRFNLCEMSDGTTKHVPVHLFS